MTTGRGLMAGRLSATRGLLVRANWRRGSAITIEGHFSVRISNASPEAVITFLVPVCVSRA